LGFPPLDDSNIWDVGWFAAKWVAALCVSRALLPYGFVGALGTHHNVVGDRGLCEHLDRLGFWFDRPRRGEPTEYLID
jgi:hypothetical protein